MRYFLLATLGTALFFGAYWLLMRRETRHEMVRGYLVGTLLLALLLPAFHLQLALPIRIEAPAVSSAQLVWNSSPESGTFTGTTTNEGTIRVALQQDETGVKNLSMITTHPEVRIPLWKQVLPWVYLAGCVVMLALLVVRLMKLTRRLHQLPYETIDVVYFFGFSLPVHLTVLDDETPAFSFGRNIVLGRNGFSPIEVQQLVGHEMVHVREAHTVDLILCQLVQVLLWFNPFVWLYVRELKRVHEFIADSEMLQTDSASDYAELFYHQVSGQVYSPLGNTFDYRMIHQRIGMMRQERSRRGWMKPLVLLPLVALMLAVGCTPKGSLNGLYTVNRMTLMSDNPAEPNLQCSEFLELENRLFAFRRDGRMLLLSKDSSGYMQQFSYTLDSAGLHLYDSIGHPWMDMTLETLHCDGDSIVLRFVDPNPVNGLGKMLHGLSPYRYKIDTVNVSSSGIDPDGEPIEVDPHKEVDTTFAHVTVPCEYNQWCYANRLLTTSAGNRVTGMSSFIDTTGREVIQFYTGWEFVGDTLSAHAREVYDTVKGLNPRMEGDRFILEIVLQYWRSL